MSRCITMSFYTMNLKRFRCSFHILAYKKVKSNAYKNVSRYSIFGDKR